MEVFGKGFEHRAEEARAHSPPESGGGG